MSVSREFLEKLINDVKIEIEHAEFKGYDPADVLQSRIIQQISKKNKTLRRFLIHCNTYSPINFRKLLGIPPMYNITAMIILADVYRALLRITGESLYIRKMEELLSFLYSNGIKKKNGIGWSRLINYQSKGSLHTTKVPLTLLTAKAGMVFLKAFKITGNKTYLEIAENACNCILNEMQFNKDELGVCLSYIAGGDERIYNASAVAAQFLFELGLLLGNKSYKSLSMELTKYICKRQNPDGSWYYGYYGNVLKKQRDFHQGFILDSLIEIYKKSGGEYLKNVIVKGAEYYKNFQFLNNGRSKWRYPIIYPIDIHNQAQGIITFSKLKTFDNKYFNFSKVILDWTVNNMYDKKKSYFYYQKFPLLTNKIRYLRWSQALMLHALVALYGATNREYE